MFKKEVVQEIWRASSSTFVVMYPLPHVAYIKGFRGSYTRQLAKEIRRELIARGIKEAYYERLRDGKFHTYKLVK